MKKCAVLLVSCDSEKVELIDFEEAGYDPTFYTEKNHAEDIVNFDEVIYVFSRNTICASSLQAVILNLIWSKRIPGFAKQWLFKLEDVDIPEGFAVIKELPQGPPELKIKFK